MEMPFALLTALVVSYLVIKVGSPIAYKIDLLDRPSHRKVHNGSVPLIGGLAIFFGVIVSALIWLPESKNLYFYIVASAFMVFIGLLDDKHDLSVRSRVVGQILITSLMIFGADTYITEVGVFPFWEGRAPSYLGVALTYFGVLGAINAFNMIDGIDGLAGTLGGVTLASLAFLFLIDGSPAKALMPVILLVSILPFLYFNVRNTGTKNKKIFLGDSGSMFIGFSVVWLLIGGSQGRDASFSPVTALWLIGVPLMDMVAIMYRRKKKKQSVFKPDRDHLHHIFMRVGFSQKQSLVLISLISVVFAGVGVLGEIFSIPDLVMLIAFFAAFFTYCFFLKHVQWVPHLLKKVRIDFEEPLVRKQS